MLEFINTFMNIQIHFCFYQWGVKILLKEIVLLMFTLLLLLYIKCQLFFDTENYMYRRSADADCILTEEIN